jgi:hypothetical protein
MELALTTLPSSLRSWIDVDVVLCGLVRVSVYLVT